MSHNESAINRGLRVLGKLKGLSVYDVINVERISINTWGDGFEEKREKKKKKKKPAHTYATLRFFFFRFEKV